MKQAQCKQLRGVCDTMINGKSPLQMGMSFRQHMLNEIRNGEMKHKHVYDEFMSLPREEQREIFDDLSADFDSFEDA